MSSTIESRTAISPMPHATLRLRLQPDGPAYTLLDGGWWPRSADPAAELPGLILALDKRHGPVSRIMLGMADWDSSRPRRLRIDGPAGRRVVRLGWFATMPPACSPRPARAASEPICSSSPRIPASRRPRRPWNMPLRPATAVGLPPSWPP